MPKPITAEERLLLLGKWVVRRRLQDRWSFHRIARERGLPKSTVLRWIRWAEEDRELTHRKRGRKPGTRPVTGRADVFHEVAVMRNSWRWGPQKITRELRRDDTRLGRGERLPGGEVGQPERADSPDRQRNTPTSGLGGSTRTQCGRRTGSRSTRTACSSRTWTITPISSPGRDHGIPQPPRPRSPSSMTA